MPKILEVIVSSLDEAIEAERGGADRVELVRSPAQGGLTPSVELVRNVLQAAKIPVRVMLREASSSSAGERACMLELLERQAAAFGQMSMDGLVAGFVEDGSVDVAALRRVLKAAPEHRVTFHRAFEHVKDPLCAIRGLQEFRQIDRILTSGCEANGRESTWRDRAARLVEWQKVAGESIRILVGGGLTPSALSELATVPELLEFHVGKAARIPATTQGTVRRGKVAALKSLLE